MLRVPRIKRREAREKNFHFFSQQNEWIYFPSIWSSSCLSTSALSQFPLSLEYLQPLSKWLAHHHHQWYVIQMAFPLPINNNIFFQFSTPTLDGIRLRSVGHSVKEPRIFAILTLSNKTLYRMKRGQNSLELNMSVKKITYRKISIACLLDPVYWVPKVCGNRETRIAQ